MSIDNFVNCQSAILVLNVENICYVKLWGSLGTWGDPFMSSCGKN